MNLIRAYLSFRGRLNRTQYATVLATGYILSLVLVLSAIRHGGEILQAAAIVLIFVMIWVLFATLTKRLYDINWTGLWCLVVFVPVVGYFVPFVMLFCRGDENDNFSALPNGSLRRQASRWQACQLASQLDQAPAASGNDWSAHIGIILQPIIRWWNG